MKTSKVARFLIVAIVVGFISATEVYAASPAAMAAKNIRQKFVDAVQNAEELTSAEIPGQVEVLFTINDDGTINIKKIDGTNEDITQFVKDKISNIPCNEYVYPYNQYYKVKFRFQED